MDLHRFTGIQVKGLPPGREIEDIIIAEEKFGLYVNDLLFSEHIASGDRLRELGAGFVITEGLAPRVDSVEVTGNEIRVYAPVEGPIERELRSSGCIGAVRPPGRVNSQLSVRCSEITRYTEAIESPEWRKTGALHSAVLIHDGDVAVRASDIGRHNTVDKVVGYAVLNGIPTGECVIGCTGRQPAGMVAKYGHAGVPIAISRAASTREGIRTAAESGVTLICFSRGDRFTVYTHPERITDLR